jgi:hypothetical protein
MNTLDLSGLGRLRARVRALGTPSDTAFSRLGIAWAKIIDEDNSRGIMAGTDKDGHPMVPVKYRPAPTLTIKTPTKAQRNTANGRLRRGAFSGYGPAAAGLHNNLTSREYRRLAGPPLAPRGRSSRVITNLRLRFGLTGPTTFETVGYWDEVVSTKGVPFLKAHFDGASGLGKKRNITLPRRDLRGVRPEGMRRAATALRAWGVDLLRGHPGG